MLLALVLGGAVRSITLILIYIVLGLLLALALDPIVRMLERRGRKRGTRITLVFAGFLVIAGFFTIFLLPPVVNQIGQFIAIAPEGSSIIGSVILAGLNAGTVFVLHLVIGLPFAALMRPSRSPEEGFCGSDGRRSRDLTIFSSVPGVIGSQLVLVHPGITRVEVLIGAR
ncbi:AI-2E family transporter [Microbacterium sp. P5_E9]